MARSPFDAGRVRLAEVLALSGTDGSGPPASAAATVQDVRLWLPTRAGLVLASSPLVADLAAAALMSMPDAAAAGEGGGVTLTPWLVTGVRLPVDQLTDLLLKTSASLGGVVAHGVIAGPDLVYWAQALRLAASLVARERFIPGLTRGTDDTRARWEPLVMGEDRDRVRELAAVMPSACRALARGTASQTDIRRPPSTPPGVVLSSFISVVVDHLARDGAANGTTTREGQRLQAAGRRASRVAQPMAAAASVHDRWVAALRSPDGRVEGTDEELSSLSEQVGEWRRRLLALDSSHFTLAFRLEEPALDDDEASDATSDPDAAPGVNEAAADAGRPSGRGRGARRLPAASDTPVASASDAWQVHYLLQSVEDPSLLLPAADVWRSSRRSSLLARAGGDPRMALLQSLGHAAAISSGVEASLAAREPTGFVLDTTGAHAFLAEGAWALRDAGFRVMLPAWWTRKGKRTGLRVNARVATPKMTAPGALSLDTLVTVDWDVMLGDTRVSRSELEALARLKAPLIRLRGQWVEVSAEDRRHALRLLDASTTRTTARELVHLALGAARPPGNLDLAGVDAQGWLGELMARLEAREAFEELPAPEGFNGQLRPYQVRGYSWLAFMARWGLGACLADDMGLGKTVQTLALVQRAWRGGDGDGGDVGDVDAGGDGRSGGSGEGRAGRARGRRPTLLICPTSVVGNWQKEAARFTPDLPVLVHHGLRRAQGDAFVRDAAQHGLVVSSYSLLHRDEEVLRRIDWQAVVLDEAQNIKNAETRQARAARALRADARLALTGTPVENNVGDLWSILEFLNPGLLGTAAEFKKQFFIPIQLKRDPDATARLKRATGSFILRRLKTDRTILADLPDKLEMKVFCTLTREQASLYAAVVRDVEEALKSSEGIQRKGLVLAALSRLKQVCNHPAQFLGDGSSIVGRSGKLARLTEMLEEVIAAGERALVFTQFAEMGAIIRTHLQETFGREVLFLHGGVPKAQRDAMVERFQAPLPAAAQEPGQGVPHVSAREPLVFVLSLKAGGTGLNLTAARHVFLFDRWWNPAVEAQAIDRAHRIGQKGHVQVHKFLCVGTLEERIDELIERKQQLAAEIVGTGEAWLTELSTKELHGVLALREGAVAE